MNVEDVKDFSEIEKKDIIPAILKRQNELMLKYKEIEGLPDWPVDIDHKDAQIWIKDFLWRVTEELMEAREAKLQDHLTHQIEELIDAIHFLAECFLLIGKEPELEIDGLEEACNPFEDYDAAVLDCVYHLGMVGNTLKNKKWKQTQMLTDKPKFLKHLNQAWEKLFMSLYASGCDSYMIYNFYFKKAEVNTFRQRTNY